MNRLLFWESVEDGNSDWIGSRFLFHFFAFSFISFLDPAVLAEVEAPVGECLHITAGLKYFDEPVVVYFRIKFVLPDFFNEISQAIKTSTQDFHIGGFFYRQDFREQFFIIFLFFMTPG